MHKCTICGEVTDFAKIKLCERQLCLICGKLFQWFMGRFECIGEDWITPATTLLELGIESLDLIEIFMEAEERFDFTIPDEVAEKIPTVGEFLLCIRLHGDLKGLDSQAPTRDSLWDRELDG